MKKLVFAILVLVLVQTSAHAVAVVQYKPADDNTVFANPERGIYLYSTFNQGGNNSWSGIDMSSERQLGRSLALFLVELDQEVNSALLPQSLLDGLDATLKQIASGGFKVVFRARYKLANDDCSGGSTPADPDLEPSLGVINDHISQLANVINNNRAAVAFVESGMIGAWGEWNCSRHLDEINTSNKVATYQATAESVINTWLDAVPELFIGVRRPWIKTVASLTDPSRVSHYNDCFLSSESHAGTYETNLPGREFLQGDSSVDGDTAAVPIGGENCGIAGFGLDGDGNPVVNYQYQASASADPYAPDPNDVSDVCAKGVAALEDYQFTYLNHRVDLNEPLTSRTNAYSWWPYQWEQGGCWEQIQRNLGYRFDLEGVEFAGSTNPGEQLKIAISVNNTGYARLYRSRPVELVFVDDSGEETSVRLNNIDASRWQPGQTTVQTDSLLVPASLASGSYVLGLRLPDVDSPDNALHAIRFANTGWEPTRGIQFFASEPEANLFPVGVGNGSIVTVFDEGGSSLFGSVLLDDDNTTDASGGGGGAFGLPLLFWFMAFSLTIIRRGTIATVDSLDPVRQD